MQERGRMRAGFGSALGHDLWQGNSGAWILISAGQSVRLVCTPAGDFQSPLCRAGASWLIPFFSPEDRVPEAARRLEKRLLVCAPEALGGHWNGRLKQEREKYMKTEVTSHRLKSLNWNPPPDLRGCDRHAGAPSSLLFCQIHPACLLRNTHHSWKLADLFSAERRPSEAVTSGWSQGLGSAITSCVTLGKLLNRSVPQFPHPKMGMTKILN